MSEASLDELRGRKLGRILTKMGHVTRGQVQEALGLQKERKSPIGQILIELGYVNADQVNLALAAQAGMQTIDPSSMDIPDEIVKLIPAEMAQAYQVLPISHDPDANQLTVALKSADNFRAVDDLRLLMGFDVKAVVAPAEALSKLIDQFYGQSDESLAELVSELAGDEAFEEFAGRGESIDIEEVMSAADDNKVRRLLNLVLLQAIKDKASDIHFEPFEDEFKMRYRIDGVLYEMIPPPPHMAIPIVSRVKVMANLDIAERRLPQDGRIELDVNGEPIDLRVAILPTMFGESVVMRVLDRGNTALELDKLGLRNDDLQDVRQLMRKPNGIVIVTGPTGSGKTTTLYSALAELNEITEKILTCEDPVEYDIDGLVQIQVNSNVGLTFAAALRSFLRQDPDIILVGETRDLETARIAVQASLTGHLVFTTLHTNDAPSSIARLLDLGLETFLITATIEGIIAQRLVRKICTRCKTEYEPTEDELSLLQLTPEEIEGRTFYRGKGCDYCNGSGYKGRQGLYEIMTLNDEMRELIMKNASTQVLTAEARKRGMRTLREAGLLALYDGSTSIEEIIKETLATEAAD
ncbi:GspE/PulE family protein [Mucisphaera calidilacus]|uniref:Type II/IV secretion system protein n=1 Tax=Mucisphaera calidilacus TaxID=2527982 RepID=A0A518BXH2_9BACT|nr:ATPase, T2SS/T4P/T4SS family [Mucisphaera calidilacus]QDU71654.1 Type II/IV secretion system protein [Mucisphaera calidilacus]